MTFWDWLVVALYLALSLGIGLYFMRRASGSMEDFFIAGRSLPWWVIGFANCASYTGASAAFVMLVFQDGMVGNFWWWPAWVVWMPLVAVLWARWWRRMGIVTTAEFIELRYAGRWAEKYRVVYALYSAFGWAPLVTGYMTGWMVVELQPILGWSKFEIVLACGVLVLIYSVVSGLFGIAYNDLVQFWVYLLGAVLLLPIMLSRLGGWHRIVALATAHRGAHFLAPLPPNSALTPAVLLALCIQGLFFAASPTAGEGATAQKFMAAKDEAHAAIGQMLSAFLSLVVRVVPFIVFGVVGAALYAPNFGPPEQVWGRLMVRFAPAGLLGLVVAAEIAGFLSVANAYMNWGGSFITNDIYRRFMRPSADNRQLATVGKIATAAIVALSFLVAFLLVDRMMSWFLYINSVMIAFILPLAWLRFFWWRLNIWGEAAGVVLGLPLSYIIWFPLGFSQRPFWLAFFVLFAAGWLVILTVTLLTPPEAMSTLERFYARCRPPGLWRPVAARLGEAERRGAAAAFRADLRACGLGVVVCAAMVVGLNAALTDRLALLAAAIVLGTICGWAFVRYWRRQARPVPAAEVVAQ